MKYYISFFLIFISGFLVGASTFYTPTTTAHNKQPVDHDRYYCHETGFLMRHWELQKGKGNWMDTLVTNRWDEPTRCEEKE